MPSMTLLLRPKRSLPVSSPPSTFFACNFKNECQHTRTQTWKLSIQNAITGAKVHSADCIFSSSFPRETLDLFKYSKNGIGPTSQARPLLCECLWVFVCRICLHKSAWLCECAFVSVRVAEKENCAIVAWSEGAGEHVVTCVSRLKIKARNFSSVPPSVPSLTKKPVPRKFHVNQWGRRPWCFLVGGHVAAASPKSDQLDKRLLLTRHWWLTLPVSWASRECDRKVQLFQAYSIFPLTLNVVLTHGKHVKSEHGERLCEKRARRFFDMHHVAFVQHAGYRKFSVQSMSQRSN